MSVRHLPRVAVATAVALAAGGAAVLPAGAAFAAPPMPLTLSVSQPSVHGLLLPGRWADTLTLTAKNTTGQAAPLDSWITVAPQGALPVNSSDVALSVTPLHAPATSLTMSYDGSGLLGGISGKNGASLSVPAHSTYSWTVKVAATKSWPRNDNGLTLQFGAEAPQAPKVGFKVGTATTGGPLVATLTGDSWLSKTHPMVETLTLINRTGAPITSGIWKNLFFTTAGSDWKTLDGSSLGLQVWENGRWTAWTDDNLDLPGLNYDLAKGAEGIVKVRISLLNETMPTARGHFTVDINGGINGAIDGGSGTFKLDKVITVYR
jgi:hypothetical protein